MKTRIWMSFLIATLSVAGLASAYAAVPSEAQESEAKLTVDINHADVEELTKLPGVGEKVAQRIVAHREENGPFEKTEELMNVRGIGEKTYLKLKPFLTLDSDGRARNEK